MRISPRRGSATWDCDLLTCFRREETTAREHILHHRDRNNRCSPSRPQAAIDLSMPPISRATIVPRACFLAGLALAEYALRRQTRRVKKRRRTTSAEILKRDYRLHNSFSQQFQTISKHLDRSSFKRLFRMSRSAFMKLFSCARPYFPKLLQKRSAYRRETLPVDVRLAATLRVLAGAEVVDVALNFGIGVATVYHIFHEVVKKLDRVLQFPKLARSHHRLRNIALKFKLSRSQNSPLDGCVGALDGICITIAKPDRESNPAFFSVERDTTRYLCKQYVTLTTFFVMLLVSVEAQHTMHWQTRFQGLWRKWRRVCWGFCSGQQGTRPIVLQNG